MRAYRLILVLVLLSLLVAGCGGDGEEGATATSPPGAGAATATATTAMPAPTTTPTAQPTATTAAPTATVAASPTAFAPSFIEQPTRLLVNGLQQAVQNLEDYGVFSVASDGSDLRRISPEGTVSFGGVWSPDGRQVAYTRFLSAMDEPGGSVVVVADGDGTNERVLTTSSETEMAFEPVWSPDGSQIAFKRVVDTSHPVERWIVLVSVMDADGSNLHDIGPAHPMSGAPSWSPDGARLVFAGTTPTEQHPLGESENFVYVARADGSDLRAIVGPDLLGTDLVLSAGWSPDGATVSFLRFTADDAPSEATPTPRVQLGLWLVNPDGSNPRMPAGDAFRTVSFPVWSPDGSRIAFLGSPLVPRQGRDDAGSGIYLMNADGSDLRLLVDPTAGGGAMLMAPSWSPDGHALAYLAIPAGAMTENALVYPAELRLTAADGSEQGAILSGFFVLPSPDQFDAFTSPAPVWRPVAD